VIALFALGVAMSTAIFGAFNGLFLSPLPFFEPRRGSIPFGHCARSERATIFGQVVKQQAA
jgi:hypothetical protein